MITMDESDLQNCKSNDFILNICYMPKKYCTSINLHIYMYPISKKKNSKPFHKIKLVNPFLKNNILIKIVKFELLMDIQPKTNW